MDIARTVVLLVSVITTGLTAGLFVIFAHTIMPSLRGAGDRTFVEAMQRINSTILNPWFFAHYLGGLAFTIASAVLHWDRAGLVWIVVAGALHVATLAITGIVNVPLNNELDAAGLSGDLAPVRARFERRWIRWNTVRSVTSLGAFVAIAGALAL